MRELERDLAETKAHAFALSQQLHELDAEHRRLLAEREMEREHSNGSPSTASRASATAP